MGTAATARAVVDLAREQNITFIAASIAYYAFFSIIPSLLLLLAVGSLVGEQAFADRIIGLVEHQLSSQGQTVVQQALTSSAGRGGASVVGVVGLLWAALKMFRAVDIAFDHVYRSERKLTLIRQVVHGVVVLTSIGLSVAFMIGIGTVIGNAESIDVPGIGVIGWAGLTLGLVVVLLPMFYVMPPVEVRLGEVLPGTVFTIFGWFLLQAGFQLYASHAGQYQAYGLIGAVLLFLTWLYFASLLMLVGATINAVLAGR